MKAEMTEIVMPSDTNYFGTCFVGVIMSWMDKVAAIAAQRLVGDVVTASVDRIEFKNPIKIGDVVTLQSSVNRVWKTSMEVGVKVLIQLHERVTNPVNNSYLAYTKLGGFREACSAYLTFVAIDNRGHKRMPDVVDINPIIIRANENSEWNRRYIEAQRRREQRLQNNK